MPDLTIEKLQLFLLVVLPGFIAIKVYDHFVPPEKRDFGSSLAEAICYSLLNLALWAWAVVPLNRDRVFEDHPAWYAFASFGLLVVSPAVLAVAYYLVRMYWSTICAWLKADWATGWIDHPTKTAWNHFFHRRSPCWMLFHLKNGGLIGGYFGPGSYVATFPHPPEVYLCQVWKVDESGHFTEPIQDSLGAVIRYADCDIIEFFTGEEATDGGQQRGGEIRREAVAQTSVNSEHP